MDHIERDLKNKELIIKGKKIMKLKIITGIIFFSIPFLYYFFYPQHSKCECYESYVLRDLGQDKNDYIYTLLPESVKEKDKWCLRFYSISEIREFSSDCN